MMAVACLNCGHTYPAHGLPYRCPACGGVFDQINQAGSKPLLSDPSMPGIWRFRKSFDFNITGYPITLNEGNTPLLWRKIMGREVAFKCEYQNPTGSFKDRGSAIIINWMKQNGVTRIVEDSSGNAGASLAAYAREAGMKARIFVPESSSGPKRRQIESYGAELVQIRGNREDVAEAVRKEADQGATYASHAYLPFNIPGYATAAYEIFEQLGNKMPGTVIVPTGQGGLLLGLARGFKANQETNPDARALPTLVAVQAETCAPIFTGFYAKQGLGHKVIEKTTLAEGVKVSNPVRKNVVIQALREYHGFVRVAAEKDVLPGRAALKNLGFDVEPTSAIVWPILIDQLDRLLDPIVILLTGAGFKYEESGI